MKTICVIINKKYFWISTYFTYNIYWKVPTPESFIGTQGGGTSPFLSKNIGTISDVHDDYLEYTP